MNKTPVILDCDPGIDDAVALFLAFGAPEMDLLAVTAVAGNVRLQDTSRNACIIRELAGREDVPVFAGRDAPLIRTPVFAPEFHGETGLDGIKAFKPRKGPEDEHAVDAMARLIGGSRRKVTLVATGPMTNLAVLFARHPELLGNVEALALMIGAAIEGGNITPSAEFNAFADPHAAAMLFDAAHRAEVPQYVFSLDFTHTVRCTADRVAAIRARGTDRARHVASLLDAANRFEAKMVGGPASPLHDPCPVAWVIAPELFASKKGRVRVVTEPGSHFGQTRFTPGRGHARWITNPRGRPGADAIFDLIRERATS